MPEHESKNTDGGYVFVSHSHKDIREIRKIRNILEENGLEPICFYLRCLSDNDEVVDLIKREIDAREWFLLVDSENARKSTWVKTEVDYILSKDCKKMVSVSLDNTDELLAALTRLSNSLRVYLSYSHADQQIARAIYDECVKHDLKVFYYMESLKPGQLWGEAIRNGIAEAAKHGCVVTILSEHSVRTNWVKAELQQAKAESAYILPVIVDDAEVPEEIACCLLPGQYFRLKTPVSAKQLEELYLRIEEISLRRLNG